MRACVMRKRKVASVRKMAQQGLCLFPKEVWHAGYGEGFDEPKEEVSGP